MTRDLRGWRVRGEATRDSPVVWAGAEAVVWRDFLKWGLEPGPRKGLSTTREETSHLLAGSVRVLALSTRGTIARPRLRQTVLVLGTFHSQRTTTARRESGIARTVLDLGAEGFNRMEGILPGLESSGPAKPRIHSRAMLREQQAAG